MAWFTFPTAAGLLLMACGGDVGPGADLVLRNGVIHTMDDVGSVVEAVAIDDGFVVALGSNESVGALIGAATEVIDLDGRYAGPAFIEGHGHFMRLGAAQTILDLTTVANWDEVVALVAEAVEQAEPGEWIRGTGWHQEKWDRAPIPSVDDSPVHHSLTAVSPENPVLLDHASAHAAFANALALELAGYTDSSEPPPGGELVRDTNGELTGLLRETAQRPVAEAFERSRADWTPEQIDAQRRREVELAGEEALANGVATFHDAGADFATIDFLRQLEGEGALPIRLYVMVRRESNEAMDARLPEYFMPMEGNDFLTVRSIKRQIDGALGSHGAWLLEPYQDMPSSTGLTLETVEHIKGTAHVAIKHGFQVNTHAIGDRANREVLDLYEEVFDSAGRPADLRWRIEHAQHVHPDDVPRFVDLGLIASMQGVHATSDAPWVYRRLGAERAESGAYLWRTFVDRGIVVTNGTDVPVENIDPVAGIHALVTRIDTDGNEFFPEQRLTREEALRTYTINNAIAAFEDDLKGSLEVGKLGDIVVLDQDVMTVPVESLMDTQVDLTIVAGDVRYRRSGAP